MKTLLSVFLVLLLGRCGTDQGSTKTFIYTIRNETGHKMKIISYLRRSNQVYLFDLDNNTEVTRKVNEDLGHRYDFRNAFSKRHYSVDSVKIIYNNDKFVILKEECSENKRNPLNICVYHSEREKYVFTEEDYNNAIPCNNNCY